MKNDDDDEVEKRRQKEEKRKLAHSEVKDQWWRATKKGKSVDTLWSEHILIYFNKSYVCEEKEGMKKLKVKTFCVSFSFDISSGSHFTFNTWMWSLLHIFNENSSIEWI